MLEHLGVWVDGSLRFGRFNPCLHGFIGVLQLEHPHCGVGRCIGGHDYL